jgi:C4-dicarboxylate-binding protein DctP
MEPKTLVIDAVLYNPMAVDGKGLIYFGEELTKRTNGLIKVKHIWSFALSKPGEGLDNVEAGLSDMAALVLGYYPGKFFVSNFSRGSPFYAPEDLMVETQVIKKMYAQLPALHAEWEQYGVKHIYSPASAHFVLESREPMPTIADWKGKKMAVTGKYLPRYFEAAGATPLPMTLMDRPTALQTGALDASAIPLVVSFPFKLYEFAPHTLYLRSGFSLYGMGYVMNLKLWNSLPEDIQKTIMEVASDTVDYQAKITEETLAKAAEVMKGAGVTFYTLSDEERMKWAGLMGNPAATWIKEGEAAGLPAGEVMKTYFDIVKEVGYKPIVEWKID